MKRRGPLRGDKLVTYTDTKVVRDVLDDGTVVTEQRGLLYRNGHSIPVVIRSTGEIEVAGDE